MKLAYPDLGNVFQWPSSRVPALVIENQLLYRKFLKDLYASMAGIPSPAVLSMDNRPVEISKYAEIITDPINFDLNQKSLINKILAALERNALSPEHYLQTRKLLSHMEQALSDWVFELPCDILATKISVSGFLKSCGITLHDDYEGAAGEAERLIDYMQMVREFDRDKLFILVNIRSYYEDPVVEAFLQTVISHEYKVLLLDPCAHSRLKWEERWTVDQDLCEF